MSTPRPPRPVSVRGGVGGITARFDALIATARRLGAIAEDLLFAARQVRGYLADPQIAWAAVLDPGGHAEYVTIVLDALDGPEGLTSVGAQVASLDDGLRAAAAAYVRAERTAAQEANLQIGLLKLPGAYLTARAAYRRSHDLVTAAQIVLVRDPELADLVIHELRIPRRIEALAKGLPDGRGVARHPGLATLGIAGLPPRRLRDLLEDLGQRSADVRHGEIDVRILTLPGGARRAIVDITGTKSWDPLPTRDITSLTTNGRSLVGLPTAYEQGVLAAMRSAGVRHTDDVMIVGHSQGGMVAVTTARDAVARGQFRVTHVITAGAPIGLTAGALPARVRVLALENGSDVVPHLDGRLNPDRANVVTATGHRGDGTILGDHDILGSYVPLAQDVAASPNRSIREFLRSARGYFAGTHVLTHTYQIERR